MRSIGTAPARSSARWAGTSEGIVSGDDPADFSFVREKGGFVVDTFLKLDGIIGDSKDIGHVYEIDIPTWSWDDYSPFGQGSPATNGGGIGPQLGSVEVINVTKALD